MVKQLHKDSPCETPGSPGSANKVRHGVSRAIDKRKRRDSLTSARGKARRSLDSHAVGANKENCEERDTGSSTSLLETLGTPLKGLVPFTSEVMRPFVDLYENIVGTPLPSSAREVSVSKEWVVAKLRPDLQPWLVERGISWEEALPGLYAANMEVLEKLLQDTPDNFDALLMPLVQPCADRSRPKGILRDPSTPRGSEYSESSCGASVRSEAASSQSSSKASRSKRSGSSSSTWESSAKKMKAIREQINLANMALMTPQCGLRGHVADFYGKLHDTDPSIQDSAKKNRIAAVLLKNRQDLEDLRQSEGKKMSVRHKMIDSTQPYADNYSTPSKTQTGHHNFSVFSTTKKMKVIQRVHLLAKERGLSDKDVANHPSLKKIANLTPDQISDIRTAYAKMEDQTDYEKYFGPRTPGHKTAGRQADLIGTPSYSVAPALKN